MIAYYCDDYHMNLFFRILSQFYKIHLSLLGKNYISYNIDQILKTLCDLIIKVGYHYKFGRIITSDNDSLESYF